MFLTAVLAKLKNIAQHLIQNSLARTPSSLKQTEAQVDEAAMEPIVVRRGRGSLGNAARASLAPLKLGDAADPPAAGSPGRRPSLSARGPGAPLAGTPRVSKQGPLISPRVSKQGPYISPRVSKQGPYISPFPGGRDVARRVTIGESYEECVAKKNLTLN